MPDSTKNDTLNDDILSLNITIIFLMIKMSAFIVVLITIKVWVYAEELSWPPDKQELFPYFYRQPDMRQGILPYNFEFYNNSDMLQSVYLNI